MSPADRKLLLRIGLRMERQAKEAYDAAGRSESAKSTRDNIMGDVLDLRDYVERVEIAEAANSVAEGLALVPVAPSEEMLRNAGQVVISMGQTELTPEKTMEIAGEVWKSMLVAARPGEKLTS